MQLIGNNTFFYLSYGFSAFSFIAVFLYFFYKAIKNPEIEKLNLITSGILGASLLISALVYVGIELVIFLPFNFVTPSTNLNYYSIARVVFLLFFLVGFILSVIKMPKNINQIVWLFFLLFNFIEIGLLTYSYFTWVKPPHQENQILDVITSHIYNYSFSRYCTNILKPTLWCALSLFSLKKLFKRY
jgi:hypothetical protein